MPANFQPIFPLTPVVSWGKITTANTAKDGTGTVVPVFTAGVNGARLDYLKVRALGTNVATVLRVFVNNGATNETDTNNSLILEQTIAATTLSETAQLLDNLVTLDLSLPAGYVVNVTIGTTVAAGLQVTGVGGNY
ncbi:MAG: hypothetical protein KA142_02870 [Chromatiaceae bacterium]|nr:hypothetical protein [Chromatiaceae bacterium]